MKQHNVKTLFVDVGKSDFLGNEKHLKAIVEALEKDYENSQYYIALPS